MPGRGMKIVTERVNGPYLVLDGAVRFEVNHYPAFLCVACLWCEIILTLVTTMQLSLRLTDIINIVVKQCSV